MPQASKNVQAIKEAPVPENVNQLCVFPGLVNYYSKFIPQADSLLTPLYKLFEKTATGKWTEEGTCKFLRLANHCLPAKVHNKRNFYYELLLPVRQYWYTMMLHTRQLKLSSDASQYGLGAVLSHIFRVECPIVFASQTLSKA